MNNHKPIAIVKPRKSGMEKNRWVLWEGALALFSQLQLVITDTIWGFGDWVRYLEPEKDRLPRPRKRKNLPVPTLYKNGIASDSYHKTTTVNSPIPVF